MPPVQPSLRGTLLTGASVLALSVTASGAHGQSVSQKDTLTPTLKVWGEGALFNTAGGSFNVPTLLGAASPFSTFTPRSGIEGALGFDYRWPDQSWHFVFDIRYGKTRTAVRNGSTSSAAAAFTTFGVPLGPPFTGYSGFRVNNRTDTNSSRTTERESHLVADFMVGRDLGLGAAKPNFQLGVRVADLRATASTLLNSLSNTNSTTFYSGSGGPILVSQTVATTSTATFATWKSRFFGVGPRAAVAGGIPIVGAWTFDYGGGVAGLVGNRTFDASIVGPVGNSFTSKANTAFVFNVDAMIALSYAVSKQFQVSGGMRGDYYTSALSTFNVATGALQNVDRLYWGPFVRLTGAF